MIFKYDKVNIWQLASTVLILAIDACFLKKIYSNIVYLHCASQDLYNSYSDLYNSYSDVYNSYSDTLHKLFYWTSHLYFVEVIALQTFLNLTLLQQALQIQHQPTMIYWTCLEAIRPAVQIWAIPTWQAWVCQGWINPWWALTWIWECQIRSVLWRERISTNRPDTFKSHWVHF